MRPSCTRSRARPVRAARCSVFVRIEDSFELAYGVLLYLDSVVKAGQVLLVALPIGAEFVQRLLVTRFECCQAALKVDLGRAVRVDGLGEVGDGLVPDFQLRQSVVEAGLKICDQTSSAGARAALLLPPRRLRFGVQGFPPGIVGRALLLRFECACDVGQLGLGRAHQLMLMGELCLQPLDRRSLAGEFLA
jgi:hypothetical protein